MSVCIYDIGEILVNVDLCIFFYSLYTFSHSLAHFLAFDIIFAFGSNAITTCLSVSETKITSTFYKWIKMNLFRIILCIQSKRDKKPMIKKIVATKVVFFPFLVGFDLVVVASFCSVGLVAKVYFDHALFRLLSWQFSFTTTSIIGLFSLYWN